MYALRQFTTVDPIRSGNLIEWLRIAHEFFGSLSVSGSLSFPSDSVPLQYRSLEELESAIAGSDWRSQLCIAWEFGDGITGGIDIFRFDCPPLPTDLGRLANYQQNSIALEIPVDVAHRICTSTEWGDVFSRLSLTLKANYGLFHFSSGLERLNVRFGLEAGLIDIFSLNYFGTPMVQLIGETLLRESPGFIVVKKSDDAMFLQVMDDPCIQRVDLFVQAAEKIKNHLGLDLFIPNQRPGPSLPSGEIGLFTFFKNIARLKRDYESPDRLAERRPNLDWEGMFPEAIVRDR